MSAHVDVCRRRHAAARRLAAGSAALLTALYLPTAPAQTATPTGTLQEVVVTGSSPGTGQSGFTPPASVLTGQALNARRAGTLGETLSGEPGVGATGYGPNASRPTIRGLDGDRVRIMQNGSASSDVSTLSYDHATTIEPMVAESIEVVRGPEALRYGGNAAGGAVNVLDNRIPTAPIDGPGGRAELRAGSGDHERAGVAVLEGGNGRFAVHADAYQRDTRDLAIPGYARSDRQRAIDARSATPVDQPYGRLPNSFSRSDGGSLGGSMTWRDGYLGMALGSYRSTYGTPAEPDSQIVMRKETLDLAGETRKLPSLVDTVRFRLNHTDYRHDETEKADGTVNTTFKNRAHDARIEVVHKPLGPLRGSFGLQSGRADVSALGTEAYVPRTQARTDALFIYEELAHEHWKLNAGARAEHIGYDSDGDSSAAGLSRFGAPASRSFNASSLSAGGSYNLDPRTQVAMNLSSTERAPTNAELFANGPHAATGAYEVGNPDFKLERSNSIDLALRRRDGDNRYSLGVFQTRFSNYIALAGTGRLRGTDGSLEDAANPGVSTSGLTGLLPEFAYRQVPALFRGVEAQGRWRLLDGGHKVDLEARADYVRATDLTTNAPLPRIAPLRLGLGLVYQSGQWLGRGDLTRAAAQNRVAPGDLPTDGYTMLNLYGSYRLKVGGPAVWELFARATNLLNADARNASSLLKDIAPMGGRALTIGIRATF